MFQQHKNHLFNKFYVFPWTHIEHKNWYFLNFTQDSHLFRHDALKAMNIIVAKVNKTIKDICAIWPLGIHTSDVFDDLIVLSWQKQSQ